MCIGKECFELQSFKNNLVWGTCVQRLLAFFTFSVDIEHLYDNDIDFVIS